MGPDMARYLPILHFTMQVFLMLQQYYMRWREAIRRRRETLIRRYLASRRRRFRMHTLRYSQYRARLVRLAEMGGTRRWWVYPRSSHWWRTYVMVIWEDEQWLEHFRMTKGTFLWLVDSLKPRLKREATSMRDPISVEERVAIAIWYLANTTSYRVISQVFGVGRSTVASIVVEVCLALETELYSSIVRPGPPEKTMEGFATLGFPHCVGAMDGCHIFIRAPAKGAEAYTNRNYRYSVLLQAIVDHTGCFIDAAIGNVSRNHNVHVLRCASIFDAMDSGVWVPGNPTLTIEDIQIPPLIVADTAYPIRSWLVTPYTGTLSPEQAHFNHVHNKARSVVERAFGRLKARWRCLLLQLPVMEENINSVIHSCMILHNVCEDRGHPVDWQEGERHHAPVPQNNEAPAEVDVRQQEEGMVVRLALTRWLQRLNRP